MHLLVFGSGQGKCISDNAHHRLGSGLSDSGYKQAEALAVEVPVCALGVTSQIAQDIFATKV